MLAAALARKRPADTPAVVLHLPLPPKVEGEVALSPPDAYTIQLMPGESVVLGRSSHGRLGESDAK